MGGRGPRHGPARLAEREVRRHVGSLPPRSAGYGVARPAEGATDDCADGARRRRVPSDWPVGAAGLQLVGLRRHRRRPPPDGGGVGAVPCRRDLPRPASRPEPGLVRAEPVAVGRCPVPADLLPATAGAGGVLELAVPVPDRAELPRALPVRRWRPDVALRVARHVALGRAAGSRAGRVPAAETMAAGCDDRGVRLPGGARRPVGRDTRMCSSPCWRTLSPSGTASFPQGSEACSRRSTSGISRATGPTFRTSRPCWRSSSRSAPASSSPFGYCLRERTDTNWPATGKSDRAW